MLYSIGHSTRSYDELVEVLHACDVTTLVDIRSITRSRANPQFSVVLFAAATGDFLDRVQHDKGRFENEPADSLPRWLASDRPTTRADSLGATPRDA
jgi:hypothetical protein